MLPTATATTLVASEPATPTRKRIVSSRTPPVDTASTCSRKSRDSACDPSDWVIECKGGTVRVHASCVPMPIAARRRNNFRPKTASTSRTAVHCVHATANMLHVRPNLKDRLAPPPVFEVKLLFSVSLEHRRPGLSGRDLRLKNRSKALNT